MEKHVTVFAESDRNKVLGNATVFNYINAASRMSGSKWRPNFAF